MSVTLRLVGVVPIESWLGSAARAGVRPTVRLTFVERQHVRAGRHAVHVPRFAFDEDLGDRVHGSTASICTSDVVISL